MQNRSEPVRSRLPTFSSSDNGVKGNLLFLNSVGEGISAAFGGRNVSGPSELRLPNRLLRRLVSFGFVDVPVGFVGVGGSSSTLDWLSLLPEGEFAFSSPSTLTKLAFRVNDWLLVGAVKILELRSNNIDAGFWLCDPNGVLGVPNSG